MSLDQSVMQDQETTVAGLSLRYRRSGSGVPLLFLHSESGIQFSEPLLAELAKHFDVIAPHHPGWGYTDDVPSIRSVDDISYVYLALLEDLDLRGVVVVGASLGGWLAAELIAKRSDRISRAVLISPLGIRASTEPTVVDIRNHFALAPAAVDQALYGSKGPAIDLSVLSDEKLEELAVAREITTRLAWDPYMHDPSLRWRLAFVNVPVLTVWGDDNQYVSEAYIDAFDAALPMVSRSELVGAGHRIDEQLPAEVAHNIVDFVREGNG